MKIHTEYPGELSDGTCTSTPGTSMMRMALNPSVGHGSFLLDRMVEFRRCTEIFNFAHKWHRIEILQILEHAVSRCMR